MRVLSTTMRSKLIECIPNFSEGRRADVVDQIVDAVKQVPGILLLDYSSDADHNRTVITFAGTSDAVVNAAFAATACAARLIDLEYHTGTHPRLGATDVIPFVPIGDSTLEDCIHAARKLGQRIGSELAIPVYLYEAAATRPDRQRLEHIRRGGYETLKAAIETDADRVPDYGPRHVGRAGATIVGARQPLVAFNVYLATDDVHLARRIARQVRESSGGFQHVKALGMRVGGMAQVSMNFTNLRVTPLPPVIEAIRSAAAENGVAIHHSELIGLMPQHVLIDIAEYYLQLSDFGLERVLEHRLQEVIQPGTLPE